MSAAGEAKARRARRRAIERAADTPISLHSVKRMEAADELFRLRSAASADYP
jgi:hypothetical protein